MIIVEINENSIKINPYAGRSLICIPGYNGAIERIRLMTPEPAFLYEFKPTEVVCKECGWKSDIYELKSDYTYCGEEEVYSNSICPKCGEWDCVEGGTHFETIPELEKRIGKPIGEMVK